MYAFDRTGDFRDWLARLRARGSWQRVPPNVWFIGLTSLLTDVSSEMVASILPLYLVLGLGLSPLMFGVVDGLYPGVTALVRWGGGALGDRTRQHKALAALGYGLSAVSRLGWLLAGPSAAGILATVTADRIGKGARTAPRDALISLSAAPDALGAAFGVHRAMDAAGAMLGPLTAVLILGLAPQRFDLVFVTSFCLGVAGLSVLLLLVGNPQAAATESRSPLAASGEERRARLFPREAGLWLAFAAGAGLALLTISDAFVYLVLQRRGVVDAGSIPLLYVGTSAIYLLLAVPFGAWADRWARWKVFIVGHLFLVVAYGALVVTGGGAALVPVVLICLGGYYAATDGVLSALASSMLTRAERGSGLGLLTTGTSLGRLGASVLFGWAWSAWGDATALAIFLAALPLAMLAGSVLLARAQREIIAA